MVGKREGKGDVLRRVDIVIEAVIAVHHALQLGRRLLGRDGLVHGGVVVVRTPEHSDILVSSGLMSEFDV
jgi:hypothetical protein